MRNSEPLRRQKFHRRPIETLQSLCSKTFLFQKMTDSTETETVTTTTNKHKRGSITILGKSTLKSRQLGLLLPLVPVLVETLKGGVLDADADAGDVQNLLHTMLDVVNLNGDVTIRQLNELFDSYGSQVWGAAVRKIVVDSDDPVLVPGDVGLVLIKCVDDFEAVKQALEELTRTQYMALGSLCASLRDFPARPDVVALVGLRIIARHTAIEFTPEEATRATQNLFENAAELFGRVGIVASNPNVRRPLISRSTGDSNHDSSRITTTALPPVDGTVDPLLMSRKHAMKAFFQWQNESLVDTVDELFENHAFADIARGVWIRYDVLPGGWRGELEELRETGQVEYAWVPKNGTPLVLVKETTAVVLTGAAVSSTAAANALSPKSKKTTFTMTKNIRRPDAFLSEKDFANVNLVINEILDSEMHYVGCLKELQDLYVAQLRDIASGKRGPEAQALLGISLTEIESVFGWRLSQVVEVSQFLLHQLEIVNLVRSEMKKVYGGRAGQVASAFAEVAPRLSISYAPFVSGHRTGLKVLTKAEETFASAKIGLLSTLSQRFSGRGTVVAQATFSDPSSSAAAAAGSFLKLWETAREGSKRLRGQTLQSLLIMPIQRVPRYKLLLTELDKKLAYEHPAKKNLNLTLAQVANVADQINQALRQHEKIEALVGHDKMPEIQGASLNSKHNSLKVSMHYKA